MKHTRTIGILAILTLFNISVFAQKFNPKLAAELAKIYKNDQHYRVAAIAAAKKYGSGSKQDNELMTKQDVADLANLAKIEKIIATYGYPGKTLVGAQSKVAFMVVQHNDVPPQEKYLPLFIQAAKKGELDRTLLPLMIDRVRTGKGQPQLYGTQLSEKKDRKIQIKPIEDEINVNIRRKEAGLPPLEDYYKQWGIDYKVPTAAGNPNPKELYATNEEPPESPIEAIGGYDGIKERLNYPAQAKEANITGYVTIQLTVDKEGVTKDIMIVKGLGYGCDEEAIRVIKETRYTNKSGEDHEIRVRLPFPYNKGE